jgi:hypothetical protein
MARVVGITAEQYLQWNGRVVEVLSSAMDGRGAVEISFDASEASQLDWFDLTASYWFPRIAFVHLRNLEKWPDPGTTDPYACKWCGPTPQLIPPAPPQTLTQLIAGGTRTTACKPTEVCPPSVVAVPPV